MVNVPNYGKMLLNEFVVQVMLRTHHDPRRTTVTSNSHNLTSWVVVEQDVKWVEMPIDFKMHVEVSSKCYWRCISLINRVKEGNNGTRISCEEIDGGYTSIHQIHEVTTAPQVIAKLHFNFVKEDALPQ